MTGAYVRISLGQRPYGPGRNGSLTGRAAREQRTAPAAPAPPGAAGAVA